MEVTFKNMSNKTTTFKVDLNETLESIVPKLMEQNSIDPTKSYLKFIYKGKVLNNASAFSDYKDDPKLVIIYMVSKIKAETNNTNNSSVSTNQPSNQTTNQTQTQAPQSVQIPVQAPTSNYVQHSESTSYDTYEGLDSNWHEEYTSGENPDEVDKLRASVIATLFFIRQSPQFTELFMNNFQTLLGVLSSPQLRPLFERMYNDSDSNDNDYMDNLTDHVSDVQGQSQTTGTNSSGQQVMTVELNDDDKKNIDTLVSLGFPKNASIQAYILCNKNVELAASMLMDN